MRASVRNVLAIARRELASCFDSPLAVIVVPVFLSLVGGFSLYFQDLLESGIASLRSVFFWAAVALLLLVPAVTMRLFAEERRTGSLELLATLPVSEGQMVLGKFFAAFALVAISLGLTFTYPLSLFWLGDPDPGPIVGGYLGLLLLGAAFTAIGTAASALTSNQITSFLIALSICLLPFVSGYGLARVPGELLPIIQYISFEYHFNNLAKGVLDSRAVFFYASVVGLFLHLAVWSLERRRLA
jgi:ABC-2 type transport system permease protein